MLIKLTTPDNRTVLVNPDTIASVTAKNIGSYIVLTTKDNDTNDAYNIKESPAEILAMLKEPDAEIASLKARIKELDDALTDSQAHLAWVEQDSRALSELRQAARELINLCNGGFVRGDCNAIKKLEALLEKP
jgi:chromosome segregation ATPase